MTRGKVVLVPFPFDDLATQKARPAVCLTEPVTSHRHIVLAFVTSREPDEPLDTDIVLDPQDPGFAQTGLQVRSTIRIHRLLTVASSPSSGNSGVCRRPCRHVSPTPCIDSSHVSPTMPAFGRPSPKPDGQTERRTHPR